MIIRLDIRWCSFTSPAVEFLRRVMHISFDACFTLWELFAAYSYFGISIHSSNGIQGFINVLAANIILRLSVDICVYMLQVVLFL